MDSKLEFADLKLRRWVERSTWSAHLLPPSLFLGDFVLSFERRHDDDCSVDGSRLHSLVTCPRRHGAVYGSQGR